MSLPVKKVGLVLKRHDPRIRSIVADLVPWLHARDVSVFLDQESAKQCADLPGNVDVVEAEALASAVDVAVVLGGDGTLLYATRVVANGCTPIMGVNLGSLGFLTEVKLEEMYAAFESLIAGEYKIEDRMLLEVEVLRAGNVMAHYLALNEAAINTGALSRIIDLEVTVDKETMTGTRADGLIISTPTGSTAYSLSAGGPILYPTLGAFVITPICPHTLTNRPVVLSDSAIVEVCLRRGSDVMLTVDGQVGMRLIAMDHVRLQKAHPSMRLVQAPGGPFFKLLREKLKWE